MRKGYDADKVNEINKRYRIKKKHSETTEMANMLLGMAVIAAILVALGVAYTYM